MHKLPESIVVLTFNPKTSKKLLNILKDYFKCMPYMLHTINDSIYVLPNYVIIKSILNRIYNTLSILDIDIFRSTIYKYNSKSHTYDIIDNSWHKNILPSSIRVRELNIEKLESFSED